MSNLKKTLVLISSLLYIFLAAPIVDANPIRYYPPEKSIAAYIIMITLLAAFVFIVFYAFRRKKLKVKFTIAE